MSPRRSITYAPQTSTLFAGTLQTSTSSSSGYSNSRPRPPFHLSPIAVRVLPLASKRQSFLHPSSSFLPLTFILTSIHPDLWLRARSQLYNVEPGIDDPDASTRCQSSLYSMSALTLTAYMTAHPTPNRYSHSEVVADLERHVPLRLLKPRKYVEGQRIPNAAPRSATGLGPVIEACIAPRMLAASFNLSASGSRGTFRDREIQRPAHAQLGSRERMATSVRDTYHGV